ncbi:MAG: hypothetical protein L0Y72_03560 [Gemmataceae bacterium]|nr:hypothetical protein [Gemmataceae bacterium]MCI0738095.1 hypothetical protein [Gemmataceae bacterium]
MSKSLSIKCDPIDQPAEIDPVDRKTWCALRITVKGRTVTRIWDKARQEERSLLYVPAFPIAEWIVTNWWTLLNEPSPTPEIPKSSAARLPWIQRHCVRSADSGLLLPSLFLFNDGRGIRLEWLADERDALPNMPGEFVDTGFDHLENSDVEDVLSEFVIEVLQRTDDLQDERVEKLKQNWQAIRNAGADEARFCVAAGRLGVDPYDPSQMHADLASFIESVLVDPDLPIARDLTEVAEADAVADQWSWIRKHTAACKLGRINLPLQIGSGIAGLPPSQFGYRMAAEVRRANHLSPTAPVKSLEEIAQASAGGSFRFQDQNHVPGRNVRAVVGWTPGHEIVLAGPRSPRDDSQRFLSARGLYLALFACHRSERLVTHSYTWDQQASRAFAAELLAPQAALVAEASSTVDQSTVEKLAAHFDASTVVIERQLENAGVTVVDE